MILTFDLLTSFLALLAAVVVYICTERLIGVDNLSRFHFSVPTLTHTHTHTHTHTQSQTQLIILPTARLNLNSIDGAVYSYSIIVTTSRGCRYMSRGSWACRTRMLHVYTILVRHVQHARFPRNMLATSSRGCHEDATSKLLPWNLSYRLHDNDA